MQELHDAQLIPRNASALSLHVNSSFHEYIIFKLLVMCILFWEKECFDVTRFFSTKLLYVQRFGAIVISSSAKGLIYSFSETISSQPTPLQRLSRDLEWSIICYLSMFPLFCLEVYLFLLTTYYGIQNSFRTNHRFSIPQ